MHLLFSSTRKRIAALLLGLTATPFVVACGDEEPAVRVPTAGTAGFAMGGAAMGGLGGDGMEGGAGATIDGGSGGSATGGVGGAGSGGRGGTGGAFGGTFGGAGIGASGMSGAGTAGAGMGGVGGADVGGAGSGGSDMGGMGGMGDPCSSIGTAGAPMDVDCCPYDPAKTAPGLCGCGYRDVNACLRHRYSFTGTGRVIEDLAGTAHGTLVSGTQANGSVALTGGTSDQYVDLPNGIVSSLASATFDVWVTWSGTGGAWQRIFDFGSSDQGAEVQGTGITYLFLTPRAGSGNLRVAYSLSSFGAETLVDAPAPLPSGSMQYVSVVVNDADHTLTLYLNGALQGSTTFFDPSQKLSSIVDENNWLGKSQYVADQELAGSLHETRVYSNARSASDIQASHVAGPDALPGTGGMGGMGMGGMGGIAGAGAGGGGMAGFGGAAGTGGAAGMGGMGGSGPMDACPSDPAKTEPGECGCGFPDADLCLRHRYSFNGTGTVATDSMGGADGTVVNAVLDAAGSVVLAGGTTDQYVSLPAGIVSSLVNATVEVWTTWNDSAATWQRIVDFGSSDAAAGIQGLGQTYLFISPRAGGGTLRAVYSIDSFNTESVVNGSAPLATATLSYLALVVDDEARTLSLYLNGALVNTIGPLGGRLADLDDVNNWLGRSQFAPDPEFAGAIHELRIYSSARTSTELSASFAAGPDVLPAD